MKKENSAIVITCIIAAVVLIIAILILGKSGSRIDLMNQKRQ